MKDIDLQPSLTNKILIYIQYCLPKLGNRFSYIKMAKILKKYYSIAYSISTLRKEFSNLKRAGLITHKIRYRKPYPALTRAGKLHITPSLPYRKFGHWDRRWRMVIFHIPKIDYKDRVVIRQTLIKLGFKKITRAVYISPHAFFPIIRRVATELGVRQNLTLIEADKIDREQKEIQKIWHLDNINQQYREFILTAQSIKKKKFWALQAKKIELKFAQIYALDPHLPTELLPKDWQGDQAYKFYKKIATSY